MVCYSIVIGLFLSPVACTRACLEVYGFSYWYRLVDNTFPDCTLTAVPILYVVGVSIGIYSTTVAAETGSLSRSVSLALSARVCGETEFVHAGEMLTCKVRSRLLRVRLKGSVLQVTGVCLTLSLSLPLPPSLLDFDVSLCFLSSMSRIPCAYLSRSPPQPHPRDTLTDTRLHYLVIATFLYHQRSGALSECSAGLLSASPPRWSTPSELELLLKAYSPMP